MSDYNRMSDIFPQVPERLLTAVQVYVNYPTPPSMELKEYLIGDMPPDASLADIEARFGDGIYRLVGVGTERTESGAVRTTPRDAKTHRVARGIPSSWEPAVRAVIDKANPSPPEEDPGDVGHSFPGHGGGGGGVRGEFMSMMGDPGMGQSFSVGAEPIVVPMGDGENLIMARGLPSDEMQRRIDEAQALRRKSKEESTLNEKMMEIMRMQLSSATAEKEAAQRRAEEMNNRLMEMLLGGGARRSSDDSDHTTDARARSLSETIDHLRRQIADMEEKNRRDRSEHWDELDRWKRRYAELEDAWRTEKRRSEELTSKLAKADLDAMLAGAKGPGGDTDEEKMQRKIAMFAQLAQGLAPVAGPILQKLGIVPGGDAPSPQLDPNAGGVPSGDIGGGIQQ